MPRMEGGDGAHAFNLVDVAARLEKALAEQRQARTVAEQKKAFLAKTWVTAGEPHPRWTHTGKSSSLAAS